MTTIYLRFADRTVALSELGAALGFDGEQDTAGRQVWSSGLLGGERYHLAFLADAGVVCSGGGDHVNLLWPGSSESIPDLDAYVVNPLTPSCVFAAC